MIKGLYRYTYLVLFCLTCLCKAKGQEQPHFYGTEVQVNGIAGKVFRHEKKFTLPIPALTTGIDAAFFHQTNGKHDWEKRCGYPAWGLGVTYVNYGIDSVYGQLVGIYPAFEFPIINRRGWQWTFRLGNGIGYVTRAFSRINPVNTINIAEGSHVNDFAMIQTDVRYHINKHWAFQAGGNLVHISNSSFRKPNLGINMAAAHAGVTYAPVTYRPAHDSRPLPRLPNRWLLQARTGMGFVASYTAGGPIYKEYMLSGFVSKRWRNNNKFFGGLDYSYHENVYAYLRNNELVTGEEVKNAYKSAVFAGDEYLLGRLGIMFQVGVYLQPSYVNLGAYYEKAGANYYVVQKEKGLLKELCVYAYVKAHKTTAETGEIGLGFGL